MITAYLIDIIYLLIAAVVTVPFFQAVKLGAVPGFLIAGIIVGPYGLGLISNISEIGNLSEIGVVFLLFFIGIELKPTRLWQMRRLVFGLGALQVSVTGSLIAGVGYLLFDLPLEAAIILGPALALSSTAFVLQLLSEKKSLRSVYGRTSIAILLLQDLAVVPLLALVPLLAMAEFSIGKDIGLALVESLLILGLVIVLGRYLLHPILHRIALSGNSEVFTASAVLLVLGTALVTEYAGLSMAMGAFLAGLFISDSSYKHQIKAEIQPFRGLLLGLFFMSMGMLFNVNLLLEYPIPILGVMCLLIIIKSGVLFPIAYLFKFKARNSFAIALTLSQSGEFALVIFSLAHQSQLLTSELFQQLLLIVLLSMLTTPLLVYFAHLITNVKAVTGMISKNKPDVVPVILAGFGRKGSKIAEILSIANIPFVALDSDALIVNKAQTNGHHVFYGDVLKPEIFTSVGASNAEIIIVALNDRYITEIVVSSLRKAHPEKNIYVCCHSIEHCYELKKLGATGTISESLEASLELAGIALITAGVEEKKQEAILRDFRRENRVKIDHEPRVENKNKINKF
ncbi:MAG: cation:proton antiporter [Gammaproteobacteria bacterium]|nr:cation:proton antiporter [Gammaproteobacteria bacterium]